MAHTCQLALQRIEYFKAAEAAQQAAAAADPNATGALRMWCLCWQGC